jgi:hypothetical protein
MGISGFGDGKIVIIVDPFTEQNAEGHNMGYLRSLPYLVEQGIHRFTYPPHWLRYGHTPTFDHVMEETGDRFRYTAIPDFAFDFHIIEPGTPYERLEFERLCQYTNETIEEPGKPSITHKILQAYNNGLIDDLVLVTNSSSFTIADHVTQKPLVEKLDRVTELSYESLAKDYIRTTIGGPHISVGNTLNIWLHQAAADYVDETDTRPTRIADLFTFEDLPTSVRTWDLLEFLASEHTEKEADHIGATVRPWIESDITRIQTSIHNALQRFEYDTDRIQRHRDTD